MLGIGAAVMLVTKLPKMLVAAGGASAAGNTTKTYSLIMCIKNPVHTFTVFCETIRQNFGSYFTGMIGDKLGWVEIEVPSILIIGYVILMILAVIQNEKIDTCMEKMGENLAALFGRRDISDRLHRANV